MFGYLKDKWDDNVNMENRVGAVQKLQHGSIVIRAVVAHTTFQNAARSGLLVPLAMHLVSLLIYPINQKLSTFFAFAEECES